MSKKVNVALVGATGKVGDIFLCICKICRKRDRVCREKIQGRRVDRTVV